jgi:hypothetical protein
MDMVFPRFKVAEKRAQRTAMNRILGAVQHLMD